MNTNTTASGHSRPAHTKLAAPENASSLIGIDEMERTSPYSRSTLYGLCRMGAISTIKLPSVRRPGQVMRRTCVRRVDWDAFLEKHRAGGDL